MDRDAAPVNALPYRVVTERLVLRCWEPRDAARAKEAIDSSLEELRPWMPWAAHGPQPLDEQVALFRTFRARFDLAEDFVYGIFTRDESEVVGGTGLHTRQGEGVLEIGYWIRTSHAGSGFATEATAALTRVAFELTDVDRVEIRVDPENERSRRIPRRLGFLEEATLRRRLHYPDLRDLVLYTLFRDAYDDSPAAAAQLEAYDVLDERVL
jgi:RimJ/RimL family protein N-acetyltransferase